MDLKEHIKQHFYLNRDVRKNGGGCKKLNIIQKYFPTGLEKLVDVGCGHNWYKKNYPNLWGFDFVYYKTADEIISIEDATFDKNSVDGVIAFGALHGEKEDIESELLKIISWVKPDGYLILMGQKNIIDYNYFIKDPVSWNNKTINRYTEKYNLALEHIQPIENKNKDRNIWVWKKL
jgi:hypothetical protein